MHHPSLRTIVLLAVCAVSCNLYESTSPADASSDPSGVAPESPTAPPTPADSGTDEVDTGLGPGPGPCPCPSGSCDASDDMPCDDGRGLCGDGVCHDTGTLESLNLPAEGYWPTSLSLSADGLLLAVSAEQGGDAPDSTGQVVVVPMGDGDGWTEPLAHAATFHPTTPEVWAVATEGAVELRTLDGTVLRRLGGARPPMAFSPSGDRLAALDDAGILVWSLDDEEAPAVALEHPEDRGARMWLLTFSPDGARVASGRGASGFGSPVGDVRVFDSATGERQHLFDCPAASGGFSTDGSVLAVACWNYTALYDLGTGTARVIAAPMLAQGARFLAPNTEGERLFMGSFVGLARVARVRPGEPLTEAAVEFPAARDVVELPDGRLILAPWADLPVHRWTPVPRL